jgi:hypothetical protein
MEEGLRGGDRRKGDRGEEGIEGRGWRGGG